MPESYPHLQLIREQPINPRRPRRARIRVLQPDDVRTFAVQLRQILQAAREQAAQDLGGFDARRLIKLELSTPLDPIEFRRISQEIEIVSQEDGMVVLAFATEEALAQFEARLTTAALQRGIRCSLPQSAMRRASFPVWVLQTTTAMAPM